MLEEERVLNCYPRQSPNDSAAVGQPCAGGERIRFRRGDIERGVLERIVEI